MCVGINMLANLMITLVTAAPLIPSFSAGECAEMYGQCGGESHSGKILPCCAGLVCSDNPDKCPGCGPFYMQCVSAPPPPPPPRRVFNRINCPIMAALWRNGDLQPDGDNLVSKQDVRDALVRTGVSEIVAEKTTDANFDHLPALGCPVPQDPNAESTDGANNFLCPTAKGTAKTCSDDGVRCMINIFRMNTVTARDPAFKDTPDPMGPLEHFRSTGIRDRLPSKVSDPPTDCEPEDLLDEFQEGIYLNSRCQPDFREMQWMSKCSMVRPVPNAVSGPGTRHITHAREDVLNCQIPIWDCDHGPGPDGEGGSEMQCLGRYKALHAKINQTYQFLSSATPPATIHELFRASNDIRDEDEARTSCGPTDSGGKCFSELNIMLTFLLQEMGYPQGRSAMITIEELPRLWLTGEYPAAFKQASPRGCITDDDDDQHGGCGACLKDAQKDGATYNVSLTLPAEIYQPGSHAFPRGNVQASGGEVQRYCKCVLAKNPMATVPTCNNPMDCDGALDAANRYIDALASRLSAGGRPQFKELCQEPLKKEDHRL